MAKLTDKFFNRVIEGPLFLDPSDDAVSLKVSSIKTLSSDQAESLKCGDIVVKVDEAGKHAYIVSYKKNLDRQATSSELPTI